MTDKMLFLYMSEEVKIYADGSCLANHSKNNFGGWAALLLWKDKSKEILGAEADTTNNRMELTSCLKALQTLKRRDLKVRVYMDSSYIINAIKKGWLKKWQKNSWKKSDGKSVENKDLWLELLQTIEQFEDIQFDKVPAHRDDQLNNYVDKLARKAAREMQKKQKEAT